MKIILPLQQPDLFRAYGKKIGGGILMYGPPGCGKTFLARATAGEVNASFLAVGISDVLDMWIGQSEKNLHSIFEQARSQGIATIGLLGAGGVLPTLVDVAIRVPSTTTMLIQQTHLSLEHALCDLVERELYGYEQADD